MTGRSGKRRLALFPASFDPITNGHLDLIQRSRSIFDEVVLALARNVSKTAAFSTEERLAILTEVTKDMEDVSVQVFDGQKIALPCLRHCLAHGFFELLREQN